LVKAYICILRRHEVPVQGRRGAPEQGRPQRVVKSWRWRDPSKWDEDLEGGAARRAARSSWALLPIPATSPAPLPTTKAPPMARPLSWTGVSGGGGNRTRVLRWRSGSSPGAVRCAFLGPGSHADKLPTGSVTAWCPASPR